MNLALWHSFMSAKKQFNVETNCRDTGESLTNASAAPMIVTNGVEFTPNIGGGCDASYGAARRRNKPLKIVIRYSITRLGRVQPRDSLPTQSSENISIWNRVEGDARGFRQDLRGSIDCRSDALFARCYRRPYRTMTRCAR